MWVEYLSNSYSHSMKDNPLEYFDSIVNWLTSLKSHIKGDTWEVEIIERAIDCTLRRLQEAKDAFLRRINP
jgi:hypothetical protein